MWTETTQSTSVWCEQENRSRSVICSWKSGGWGKEGQSEGTWWMEGKGWWRGRWKETCGWRHCDTETHSHWPTGMNIFLVIKAIQRWQEWWNYVKAICTIKAGIGNAGETSKSELDLESIQRRYPIPSLQASLESHSPPGKTRLLQDKSTRQRNKVYPPLQDIEFPLPLADFHLLSLAWRRLQDITRRLLLKHISDHKWKCH